jgi:hypothetical protein
MNVVVGAGITEVGEADKSCGVERSGCESSDLAHRVSSFDLVEVSGVRDESGKGDLVLGGGVQVHDDLVGREVLAVKNAPGRGLGRGPAHGHLVGEPTRGSLSPELEIRINKETVGIAAVTVLVNAVLISLQGRGLVGGVVVV